MFTTRSLNLMEELVEMAEKPNTSEDRLRISELCNKLTLPGDRRNVPWGFEGGYSTNNSTCSFCEYFDGGGMRLVEDARIKGISLVGDCLNSDSPRFQTSSLDTCACFYVAPDDVVG